MTIEQPLHDVRGDIGHIAAKHGARNIRVFGSVARGEARNDSDIDFLVDTGPVTSSWFPAGLVLDLEEVLGSKVKRPWRLELDWTGPLGVKLREKAGLKTEIPAYATPAQEAKMEIPG
jgi:predicted nucleotidyltransferase